jgi:hypothetical protein
MAFQKKFGNSKNKDILDLQNNYSIKLPNKYIEFLTECNGGIIEKNENNRVFIEALATYINIDVLFGLNTGNRESDIRTWTDKFIDDLFDKSIIIGDDLLHGFIVMICEGEYSGIYYWDDSYQFDESTDEENTYWIAENFSDFIKQILRS